MTGAYAMGDPWLQLLSCCRRDRTTLSDWWAAMTGGGAQQTQPKYYGPWGALGGGGMGFPPPFGRWSGRGWRAAKARPGDIRAAILGVLAEEPRNGYQVIQVIAERSGGAWKPSPGSIYPTLAQLEDEGLVQAEADGSRRTFSLTEEGRRYVREHADDVASPWAAKTDAGEEDTEGFRPLIGQLASAVWQVMATGTPAQQVRAREALDDLRRRLYQILADDSHDEGDSR